jgi:hypothetical protein
MDEIFSVLGAGIAPGSTLAQRQAAAVTCRVLLAALETPRGQPLSLLATQVNSEVPTVAESRASEDVAPATPSDDADAPSAKEVPEAASDTPDGSGTAPSAAAEKGSPSPQPAPPQASPTAKPPGAGVDPAAVAALVQAARTIPPDQLLDLAIARVRSLLQTRGQSLPPPVAPPVRFPILSLSPSLVSALKDPARD